MNGIKKMNGIKIIKRNIVKTFMYVSKDDNQKNEYLKKYKNH